MSEINIDVEETNKDSPLQESQKPTCFTLQSASSKQKTDIWKAEGTGLARINLNPPSLISLNSKEAVSTSEESNLKDIHIDIGAAATESHEAAMTAIENTFIGENFEKKTFRIKEKSSYGHLPGWNLDGFIAKSNDDLRQEVFVMQLIKLYKEIFTAENIPVWLYTYRIMCTSKSTGLIELIKNGSTNINFIMSYDQ